jgi:hypothetical protein
MNGSVIAWSCVERVLRTKIALNKTEFFDKDGKKIGEVLSIPKYSKKIGVCLHKPISCL